MEPTEFLRAVRRRWWVPALVALASVAAVLVVTPSDEERAEAAQGYVAEHTIALAPVAVVAGESSSASRVEFLRESARLFRGPEVARRVAAELDAADDPQRLAAGLSVTVDPKRATITFAARGGRRSAVVERANAFARESMALLLELEEQAREREIERSDARQAALSGQLSALEAQIGAGNAENPSLKATRDAVAAQLAATISGRADLAGRAAPAARFATVSEATPRSVVDTVDDGGVFPPPGRTGRLVLALALALALAGALVVVLDRLDSRIRTKIAAEHAFGLPVLAEIPRLAKHRRSAGGVEAAANPVSPVAEAYRAVRSSIMLAPTVPRLAPASVDPDRRGNGTMANDVAPAYELTFEALPDGPESIKVVLVTSPGAGEGRSTTVANLAATLAETGRSVAVVDCDLRNPVLDRVLDVDAGVGLSDLLATPGTRYDFADIARPTGVRGVSLVPSGRPAPNPAGLLPGAREALLRWRGAADVMIVDTPPALLANDAAELVPAADGVLVVAALGRTTADEARRTAELLARLGARVFGVVLVSADGGRVKAPRAERRGRGRHRRSRADDARRAPTHRASFDPAPPARAPEEVRDPVLRAELEPADGPGFDGRRRLRPFRRSR